MTSGHEGGYAFNPEQKAKRIAEELGLGATGAYPHGSLGDHDQGELKAAITTQDGKVVIHFGKPVAWLAMTPQQAIGLAMVILHRCGAKVVTLEDDRLQKKQAGTSAEGGAQ